MLTESRNLEFTGILRVVERQLYRKPSVDTVRYFQDVVPARDSSWSRQR